MNKKKHEELKKHISTAFVHLSKIPVSDIAVDYMAIARVELRAAIDILNREKSEETDG